MPATLQPMRRDARRNREAIVQAARSLFAESGDVPMYEVARRAGVGQATLYRNFPDRSALVVELLEEELRRIERVATEHAGDPQVFYVLLRDVVAVVARFQGITEVAREADCVGVELQRCRQTLRKLMSGPLQDASSAGSLRRDLTVDDVFLLVRMVKGAVDEADGASARAAAADRALSLLLDGLRTPGARDRAPARRRASRR